ncbi:MAG: pantoate--beta-alanine ligase [Cyclobacteriaceae bacterium]|nr:pantoate--beta-alanine ligase [Cyclobacteriaceae bacterium]
MCQVIRSKFDLKKVINDLKIANKSIGLVPTMGALHQGHLSLVQMSKSQYDVTVATIFVNPAQFNTKEDLVKYPKTEVSDIEKLSNIGCSYIFIPTSKEVYDVAPTLKISFGKLEHILEGKFRPGHFAGVGLIVMKLFGLVQPTGAYFGQKDLQQFSVITTLVRDFELPINLHLAPIIRESSGLAMSSRNQRLTTTAQESAAIIYSTLKQAKNQLLKGVVKELVLKHAIDTINQTQGIKLEYFEIVDAETLQNIHTVSAGDRLALCAAAFVAEVRLIDNIIIEI